MFVAHDFWASRAKSGSLLARQVQQMNTSNDFQKRKKRKVQQIPSECRHVYLSLPTLRTLSETLLKPLVWTDHTCTSTVRFADVEAIDGFVAPSSAGQHPSDFRPRQEHKTTGVGFFCELRSKIEANSGHPRYLSLG